MAGCLTTSTGSDGHMKAIHDYIMRSCWVFPVSSCGFVCVGFCLLGGWG